MDKLLSIIIPCYNEKKTIEVVLAKITELELPPGVGKEVIIVDDFSNDGTRDILKEYEANSQYRVFYHQKNMGKGAALRTGFERAQGDILVVQDADLEYNPFEIRNLFNFLVENYENTAVYGSRNISRNPASNAVYRVGAILITKYFNLLFGQKLTDLYTCYKMFPRRALDDIKLTENSFGFEEEISCKLVKSGYQIKEIPISYQPRSFEEGKKIRWWHGLKGLGIILKNRF